MASGISAADEKKIAVIRKEITAASKDFIAQHPVFKHQNAIGMGIFLVSIAMILGGWYLYLTHFWAAWAVILWTAFWTSILHEMEHDLIHWMYFRKNNFIHNAMMLGVWLFRPTTVNPWFRRDLHFHHHKYSGTLHDVEERGVTNGEKWGLRRINGTADLLLGGILRFMQLKKDIRAEVINGHLPKEKALRFKFISTYGMLPIGLFSYIVWYFFLIHHSIHFIAGLFSMQYQSPAWAEAQMGWVNTLVILLIAPNILRQLCLHFVTSNMHYFGDVESGNIMQQTQILNVWWTWPFQLFCFNFGTTHAIHHFVVNETFYIRQFTARRSLKIMKEQGVRFNDTGTFTRANRYHKLSEA